MAVDLALPEDPQDYPASRGEARQLARLPNGYKPLEVPGITFDPRMCFDLALRVEDPAEIFTKYGYTQDQAVDLAKNQVFQRMLKFYVDDVAENGITYKTKVRVAAEALLVNAYEIAQDPDQPAAVRADLIKWHAKVGGYEPKPDQTAAQGNGFTFQILFSGDAKQEPLTIAGERMVDKVEAEQ